MDVRLPPRYALDPDRPVLGEGGMGRVLRVWDRQLDVPVALKVVRPDLAADKRFRKLFDLEVRVSARFTHDHIVPLHDLGELGDGTPFLGLAFADGGSFANFRTTPPSWEEMLRLMVEFLDSLAHLHSRGVLHRDIKPENVLLHTGEDGKPHVWLADLGLANASNALAKRKGRVEGTPGFMAPEQRLGMPREYGPWTDLFSLGVILWELVTGDLPFPSGRSPLDSQLPSLLPREGLVVPEGLDLILANLLAAEPMSRYDLAADVTTELHTLGEPSVSRGEVERGEAFVDTSTLYGTVAPSAPRFSTTADRPVSSALEGELPPGVPLWNRPRPIDLPRRPQAEHGRDATARASLQLFALRELPLVARDGAREQLWDVVRDVVQDGVSRVVLVIGEAGSGKTRLVESVLRTLEEGGWAETVAMTYQLPPGKEDGYAGAARAITRPWNESRKTLEMRLRRRLARERGALDEPVKEEASTLARWCGLLEEDEEPVAAGYGLREVYRYLEARAWRGVSCLILDGVQWAAEEGDGLAIAEAVLRGVQDGERRRLVVFATLRAEDLAKDAALEQRVAELVAGGAVRLDLPRLDREGTRELLRECLTLTPDLMERVASLCEGNPLFARQLLIEWVDRGWLVDTGGLQFGLAEGVDVDTALPADAEALFRERVAALAEASGRSKRFVDAAHMAAIAGQVLPSELFAVLAGGAELHAFLRGCGLWTEKEDLVLFDHGLLHQALRTEALARKDAPVLHRRLARAWQRFGRSSGAEVQFQIGRHAHGGGAWTLAATSLLRAAERAWQQGLTKELEEAATLAVDACDQGELADRGGWARLWRGRALQARGDAQQAWVYFNEALELFDAEEDGDGAIEALVGTGWAARQAGELSEAETRYSKALKRARACKDKRAEAKAIDGLAWVEQQKRNFEGADILFTRVYNRFLQVGDWRGVAEASMGHAFVARRTGRFDEAAELYEEAVESFWEGEDRLGVARALHGRAMVFRQQLMVDEAEELLREAMRIAEELAATEVIMESRVGLAELHRLRGNYDRARQFYEGHAQWASRKKAFDAAIFAHLGLAHVALLEDDLTAMHGHLVDASRYLEQVPGHWLWAPYRLVVATLLALRGEEETTYRWLWSAAELGLGDIVDQDMAYFLTIIFHVAHGSGWINPLRVAGKLARSQLDRLGRRDESGEIANLMRQVLG